MARFSAVIRGPMIIKYCLTGYIRPSDTLGENYPFVFTANNSESTDCSLADEYAFLAISGSDRWRVMEKVGIFWKGFLNSYEVVF